MSTETLLKEGLEIKLDKVQDAIDAIKRGEIVIVVDDEDRENEGDFICAAEKITPELINFMATHGRGLICTPITEKRVKELKLTMMESTKTALHETAFTVSLDMIGRGCTTGISAYDRSTGIQALVDPKTRPEEFARPGHIFPLRALDGGVLRRTGHTEAAVDLARLAGCAPAGVLVEILNEDGTMARLPQLLQIAEKHDLRLISIKDLVEYRLNNESIIDLIASEEISTSNGPFEVRIYKQLTSDDLHIAFVKGNIASDKEIMVRVHSSGETNDIFGVLFDNQGEKMKRAMSLIEKEGSGVFLYMNHGDKEDDIISKLGRMSGSTKTKKSEQRDFGVGAQILRDLGVEKMKLVTNNPKKRIALDGYGLEVVETVQL